MSSERTRSFYETIPGVFVVTFGGYAIRVLLGKNIPRYTWKKAAIGAGVSFAAHIATAYLKEANERQLAERARQHARTASVYSGRPSGEHAQHNFATDWRAFLLGDADAPV